MNAKRPLTMLVALALVASVFAAGPAAASGDCTVQQSNSQTNVLNANTDLNVNAVNAAASAPVLSPGSDSDATANQVISDSGDQFQSQSNYADC